MTRRTRPATSASRSGGRHGCAGFTLVEVLVSITILGFVLVLLFGGLRTGSRVWETGAEEIAALEDRRAVVRLFRDQIAQAYPLTLEDSGRFFYLFVGEPEKLQFPIFLPPYPGAPGLHLVTFEIERQDELHQLWFSRVRLDPDRYAATDRPSEDQRRLLLESPDNLSLSYFGPNGDSGLADWHGTWRDPDRLPRMVRLAADTGEAEWPDLTAPITTAIDVLCLGGTEIDKCRAPKGFSGDDG